MQEGSGESIMERGRQRGEVMENEGGINLILKIA